MINGINRYAYYSNMFKSPFSSAELDPSSKMIYGAGITALYSIKLNKALRNEMAGYISSFNDNFSNLSSSASQLKISSKDTVYDSKQIVTNDPSIVTGTAAKNAASKEHSVKIDKVARSQINNTVKLNGSSFNELETGNQSFKISSGSKSVIIELDIKSYNTNRDVLSNINSKINNSNIGIKSNIIEDKNGNVQLSLASEKTGKSAAFTVEDVDGTLSSQLQLNNAVQNADNASYQLNGNQYESESNDIKVDNDISLTLRGVGETKLKVSQDKEKIKDAINEFVSDYNKTIDFLNEKDYSNTNANGLKNELLSSVNSNRSGLRSIGIEVKSSGKLEIDSEKLSEALTYNSDRVKNLLGSSSGISTRVSRIVDEAMEKTALSYAPGNDRLNNLSSFSSIYNYKQNAQLQYASKLLNQGILFDAML
ncbi:MAG: flagellar filament capping protein FliD [Bacillota bacterium]